MPAVITNEAELNFMNLLVEYVDCKVRLFQDDLTPDKDTVLSSLSEATFGGYAPVEITWSTPATVDEKARMISQSCRFEADNTIGGAQTVYGYYVTYLDGGSANRLLFIERFPTPAVFEFEHDVKDVTVQHDCSQDA